MIKGETPHLERLEHRQSTRGCCVEVGPDVVLELVHGDDVVITSDPYFAAEVVDGRRREAPSAHAWRRDMGAVAAQEVWWSETRTGPVSRTGPVFAEYKDCTEYQTRSWAHARTTRYLARDLLSPGTSSTPLLPLLSALTCQGQEARVVPPLDVPPGHQLVQLALRHDGVGDVKTRVLPYKWLVGVEHLQKPAWDGMGGYLLEQVVGVV